jgi:hypothetical protein
VEIGGYLAPVAIPPCFAAGTHILTAEGDVPVETLQAGDSLITAEGEFGAVMRIGPCPFAHGRAAIWIAAGGFSMGVPERDLLISPDHGIDFDGQCVPVRELVDGVVIRPRPAEETMFYSIELATRAMILAEGAALESQALAPRRGRPPAPPRGDQLAGVRARLHARKLMLGYTVALRASLSLDVRGDSILPFEAEPGRFTFALPADTEQAVLNSAIFVPAETDPSSADRRVLGVALTELLVDGHSLSVESVINPADLHRRGPAERATWTRGPARLQLPAGARELVISVAELPRCWQPPH